MRDRAGGQAAAVLLLASLAAIDARAQAPVAGPVATPVGAAVPAALEARVRDWRRDFHAHPELGNQEARTARIVAAHLRALGLEVRTGIAVHGVAAIIRGARPGPRIALRADMDGLPVTEQTALPFASKVTTQYNGETVGVMHACGHDGHTAILMGVAEALVARRAELAGEVMVFFQPAEEGAPRGETGGAARMLAEDLFADFKPEAIFGLHLHSSLPVGAIGWHAGPFQAAADSFRIVVKGRGTHGARPWLGVDPVVAAAALVTSAQAIVSRRLDINAQPAVLTFGAIRGGNRGNVIPDEVELLGTLRTFDPAMREQAMTALKDVATHVAAAHGATIEAQVPDAPGVPVNANDPALTARMLPSLRRAATGADVREIPRQTGAEDFAHYGRVAPSLFVYVGVTGAGLDPATVPANHSPRFLLDEGGLPVGVRTLLQLALDYADARADAPAGAR